jgi:hypothetical protein
MPFKKVAIGVAIVAVASTAYVAVMDSGTISVQYAESPNPAHAGLRESFSQGQWFENVAAGLDAAYLIPYDLRIAMVDCGQPNAFYDASQVAILICYELVSDLLRAFRPLIQSDSVLSLVTVYTTLFVLYHEIGHAFVHMFGLPITGREEDAVDQLATLVLLEAGPTGQDAALSGAQWFAVNSQRFGGSAPFWDEHSLDAQRYFNILCWIYGSSPATHGELLSPKWGLPPQRAARCESEFAQMSRAWSSLLAEYRH